MKNLLMRKQKIVATAAALVVSSPAYAAMDLQQGAITLGTALIVVFGVLVLVASAYKGWESVMDHRNVMPSLVGMIFGISLVAGGAWYMTQLGAASGAVAGIAL